MRSNGKYRDLNTGEVIVTLRDPDTDNEVKYTLRPTINAARLISRQFDGYAKARDKVVSENFDAAIFIIRVGSGMNDKEANKLEERVFRHGLKYDLLMPIMRYVAILNNGGRPLPEDIEGNYEVLGGDDDQDRIEDHSQGNG